MIFGATTYTTAVDIWSIGCVIAELLLGSPLFPGDSGVDQLVEVIKILGTPTKDQIHCMNPSYSEFKFPPIRQQPWSKVFHKSTPRAAFDFMDKLLKYEPEVRLTAIDALIHPFFDDLREQDTRLPNGEPLPPLFDFTKEELVQADEEQQVKLIPDWARSEMEARFADDWE